MSNYPPRLSVTLEIETVAGETVQMNRGPNSYNPRIIDTESLEFNENAFSHDDLQDLLDFFCGEDVTSLTSYLRDELEKWLTHYKEKEPYMKDWREQEMTDEDMMNAKLKRLAINAMDKAGDVIERIQDTIHSREESEAVHESLQAIGSFFEVYRGAKRNWKK